MARKKHLINVHTGTGTTAPTGASLYLGEIAVQHTPNEPALWIKVGTSEASTDYEKFIGSTEIQEMISSIGSNNTLGSGYTYSGLPYVNSATTIADAYSALTYEMIKDEKVTSAAFNDLNGRVIELSSSTIGIGVISGDVMSLSAAVVTLSGNSGGGGVVDVTLLSIPTEEYNDTTFPSTVISQTDFEKLVSGEAQYAVTTAGSRYVVTVVKTNANDYSVSFLNKEGVEFIVSYRGYWQIDIYGSEVIYLTGVPTTSMTSAQLEALGFTPEDFYAARVGKKQVVSMSIYGEPHVCPISYAYNDSGDIYISYIYNGNVYTIKRAGEGDYSCTITPTGGGGGGDVTGATLNGSAVTLTNGNLIFSGVMTEVEELAIANALNDLNSRITELSGNTQGVVVPEMSTNIAVDRASMTKTAAAGAVYNEVHPKIGSIQPGSGMFPNVAYFLGTLTGNTTFTFATPLDEYVLNHYFFTFETDSTAPTITWPSEIRGWVGGVTPTINANKAYQVSVIDGYAIIAEF